MIIGVGCGLALAGLAWWCVHQIDLLVSLGRIR